MAAEIRGRQCDTQEHGGADDVAAARELEQRVDVSSHKSRTVLPDWIGSVLLGIHRGRGMHAPISGRDGCQALTMIAGDMRCSLDITEACRQKAAA